MATESDNRSARIYQFPARARAAARASGEQPKPAADVASLRVPATTFGSGWYHEAAIQDAARTVKR
jgi:hypothetical protein